MQQIEQIGSIGNEVADDAIEARYMGDRVMSHTAGDGSIPANDAMLGDASDDLLFSDQSSLSQPSQPIKGLPASFLQVKFGVLFLVLVQNLRFLVVQNLRFLGLDFWLSKMRFVAVQNTIFRRSI